MTYRKPEARLLGRATELVRGLVSSTFLESLSGPAPCTPFTANAIRDPAHDSQCLPLGLAYFACRGGFTCG